MRDGTNGIGEGKPSVDEVLESRKKARDFLRQMIQQGRSIALASIQDHPEEHSFAQLYNALLPTVQSASTEEKPKKIEDMITHVLESTESLGMDRLSRLW